MRGASPPLSPCPRLPHHQNLHRYRLRITKSTTTSGEGENSGREGSRPNAARNHCDWNPVDLMNSELLRPILSGPSPTSLEAGAVSSRAEEVPMRISEQDKTQILRLIDEGDSLDLFDVGAFYRWSQASYDALQFDRVQQQRFDEYCRSSCGVTSALRLNVGVWMLKQVLYKAAPKNHTPMSASV